MKPDWSYEHDGWLYEVIAGELRLSRQGRWQATFPLAPLIEGAATTVGPWRKSGDDHLTAALNRGGSVHVAVRQGHVAYWIETDIVQFERLRFFPGTSFSGRQWHTFNSDEFDRTWDVDVQAEVPVASAYDGQGVDGTDGAGMTDPGDLPPTWIWNVPVRAAAIAGEAGWVGLSIPGPVPVGVTRFTMDHRRFSLTFQVLRSTCRDYGMPVVYFVAGLADPYDLLDEHRVISDRLGLTIKKSGDHPAWWSHGAYEYWDEYLRGLQQPGASEADKKLTAEKYVRWLNTIKDSLRIREINATFEQGTYVCYGNYAPTPELGGTEGLRKTIDALRQEGTRCAHYIHPFIVNTKLPVVKNRPELFCKPKDPAHTTWWPLEMDDKDKPTFAPIDWTHPEGRKFMFDQVEFMLSDKPGCLNCDILRSNNWLTPDPRRYDFHDPDWGIGDLMTMKVQKLLYEKAKQIKPDCAVAKISPADCYMQPYYDQCYLCEEWNGYTMNWYRRGRIATRLLRDVIFLIDAYFLTMTKSYEFYMGAMAWTFPVTSIITHSVHPYTTYREFQEKAYRRRRAGWHVYMHAPSKVTDLCHVDWDGHRAIQWRKRGEGPLAGWYAALAISQRCVVSYGESQALVATSESRRAVIPLPPGARVSRVEMVPHEGQARPWEHRLVELSGGSGVEMFIEDCGQEALYYRIEYELPAHAPR